MESFESWTEFVEEWYVGAAAGSGYVLFSLRSRRHDLDVTHSIGPSTHTSSLPPITQARAKVVSNSANQVVAPDSRQNVAVTASQSKVLDHTPSSRATATYDLLIRIFSNKSAIPTRQAPTAAPTERTTIANRVVAPDSRQNVAVTASQSKVLDHTPSTAKTFLPERILSAESVVPTRQPPTAAPTERTIIANQVVAPDSSQNVAVTAPQSNVLDHPSSLPPTAKTIFHPERILSTESVIPTPTAAPTERTTIANPGSQIGHSNSELHGRSPVTTKDIIHTSEVIQSTESVMPDSKPSPAAPIERTTIANPVLQIGHLNSELDGRSPVTTTKDTMHTDTEIIQSTESAMPTSQPPPASMDMTTTSNSGIKIEHSNSELDLRPLATTEDIIHTEMILNTESAFPTSEPSPLAALMDVTTTADIQIGHSKSELDGPPAVATTEDIIHTEPNLNAESAIPTSEPSPAAPLRLATPMNITTTANSGIQIGHLDSELDGQPPTTTAEDNVPSEIIRNTAESAIPISEPLPAPQIEPSDGELDGQHLGVLPSEGIPTQSSTEVAPQINEAQQQSTKAGDRTLTVPTSSEIVNMAPDLDTCMSLNSDHDGGRKQFEPNYLADVVPEESSDIVELSPTRKGKRKMIDRELAGDNDSAHIPAGDGGLKRNCITIVEEEDYSDIEYIGSWSPRKTKRVKTSVKMENVPMKLENSDVSANLIDTIFFFLLLAC